MSPRTVLIFDLDDTLILQDRMTAETVRFCTAFLGLDPEAVWTALQRRAQTCFEALTCAGWCRMVGISALEALWGRFGGAAPALAELRAAVASYRLEVWGQTLAELGVDDRSLAPAVAADFADLRSRRYYTFPEARRVLEELRPHFGLAILTNGAPELQWSKVHASGLEDLFDSVTVSGDHGIGKPLTGIFDVVRGLHPGAGGFVMIGNSLTSDIQGARNAGLPSVWFEQGDEAVDVPVRPDAVIRHLGELPAALARLGLPFGSPSSRP